MKIILTILTHHCTEMQKSSHDPLRQSAKLHNQPIYGDLHRQEHLGWPTEKGKLVTRNLDDHCAVSSRDNNFNYLHTALDINATKSQHTRAACKTFHDKTGDKLTKQYTTDT